MKEDDRAVLLEILDRLERAQQIAKRGPTKFFGSRDMQELITFNISLAGEAAKRVSLEKRALAPDVPWRRITGMRDVIVHNYSGVSMKTVWEVVSTDVPQVIGEIRLLIAKLDEPSE